MKLVRFSQLSTFYAKRLHSTLQATIVGCYHDDSNTLTESGKHLNEISGNKLAELLEISKFSGKSGKTRTFFGLNQDYPCITVTGLGHAKDNPNEELDETKENIRVAVGAACKELKNIEVESIKVDSCGNCSAAAEGANLSLHQFQRFKSEKKNTPSVSLLYKDNSRDDGEWEHGMIVSDSQNLAREFMEMPSNFKYPEAFAQEVIEKFQSTNVQAYVRDTAWASKMNMGCFLSVGKGSENKSVFLELHYTNSANTKPIVLVGKGVTFDSGGISIKPSTDMGLMRGDIGGAACVLATLYAAVRLKLPLNLIVLVPLAENMPSGSAMKPGDVFTAMNGKSVEVDNTDAEGRLILADALCYADTFQPEHVIDVATLTGAIDVALGSAAAGAYTTSNLLWNHLQQAGMSTGDRLWRMPLYEHYTKQMKCSKTADLRNTQKSARSAGSNTAAAFLKEFVGTKQWAHLDIAGVMTNNGEVPYLPSGMSGRPTRTLIETITQLSKR